MSWSPRGDRLFVVANQTLPGGDARSRGWFLDSDAGQAVQTLTLPSRVLPGTVAWSPDGQNVAFVARAQTLNALCLLGADGTFRYVADLDPSDGPPLAYPPLSWSADSTKMLFVAPHQHAPGAPFDWLSADQQHGLYVAHLDQPTPTWLADTQLEQVIWREDGQILGLGRAGSDAPLHVRLLNAAGGDARDIVELPVQVGATFAAAWDLARAQLVIVSRASAGASDYWLVRLAVDGT